MIFNDHQIPLDAFRVQHCPTVNSFPIPDVFQAFTGLLYGIAIIATIARTAIRLRLQGRLLLDDAFLLFASLALTGTTAILFRYAETISQNAANLDNENTNHHEALPLPVTLIGAKNLWPHSAVYTYVTLAWVVIFAVKASFLAFFRLLLRRTRSFLIYWKVVVGINAFAFPFCIICTFVECQKLTFNSKFTCQFTDNLSHTIWFAERCANGDRGPGGLDLAALSVDIITDCLSQKQVFSYSIDHFRWISTVVSIPLSILYKARMKPRQKFGIGAFLCLSLCTIAVAFTRGAGVYLGRGSGPVWALFWIQSEASIAVCLVSMTAFRSLFVSEKRKCQSNNVRPWYSSTVARLRAHRKYEPRICDFNRHNLPTIPSATLTGIRTFIQGSRALPDNEGDIDLSKSLSKTKGSPHASSEISLAIEEVNYSFEKNFMIDT